MLKSIVQIVLPMPETILSVGQDLEHDSLLLAEEESKSMRNTEATMQLSTRKGHFLAQRAVSSAAAPSSPPPGGQSPDDVAS